MSDASPLSSTCPWQFSINDLLAVPLKAVHLWVSLPALIFMLALTAMLFRPPDLKSFPIDRLAFLALIGVLFLRVCVHQLRLQIYPLSWPLLALLALGLWDAVTQPYTPQAWSLFAAKWAVPFVFFHASGTVFCDDASLHKLETFLLIVLVYLSAVSVLSLMGANEFIFPRFITDESIGIHADRARGPFLQAVANGVCLNLLGIIALDSFRRGRLRGVAAWGMFLAVPLALLATKTRAVWISAVLSVGLLVVLGSAIKLRRVALGLCTMAAITCALLFMYRMKAARLPSACLTGRPWISEAKCIRQVCKCFRRSPCSVGATSGVYRLKSSGE
jgi:hypothetical protein